MSAGVGEEVPANCCLPHHEGDPNQEERAAQRAPKETAEVNILLLLLLVKKYPKLGFE